MSLLSGEVPDASEFQDMQDEIDNVFSWVLDTLKIDTNATYYNGTAEALVTSASVSGTMLSINRYKVKYSVPVSSGAGATGPFIVRLQFRHTNLAGALLHEHQTEITVAQGTDRIAGWFYYDPAIDETATIVMTAQRAAGGVANATVIVGANRKLHMSLRRDPDATPRTV